MSAISGTNLGYMRYPGCAIMKPCLWAFSGQNLTKATAVITATPDAEDYPVADYSVDTESNWTTGKRGMRVVITDPLNGEIKFMGVLRSNNASGTLKVAGRQPGDRGIAGFSPRDVEVDDVVTVYQYFPPYSFPTRADLDTLELFKRWDDTFSTGNPQTQYPRPQVNIGRHIIGIAGDPGTLYPGVYRVRIDPTDSFSWNDNSLTYSWSVPTGFTLVSTSGNIRVYDIDGGTEGILSITATDSVTSKANTAYRYVYVAEAGMRGGLLTSDDYTVGIENDRHGRNGRSMTFVFTSDTSKMRSTGITNASLFRLISDNFLPGTPILFSYEHWHTQFDWRTYGHSAINSTTLLPVLTENYIGYVRDYQVSATRGGIEQVRVNVVSPVEYTDLLNFRAQELTAVDPPTNWQEVHPDLSNAAYVPFYVFDNHTFINSLHDLQVGVIGSSLIGHGASYPAPVAAFEQPRWSLDGGTMLETLYGIQRTLAYTNVGCVSDGSIILRRHPLYEASTYRANIPIVHILNDTDISAPDDLEGEILTYDRDDYLTDAETEGTFLVSTNDVTTATVYTARSGLYAPAQGRSVQTMPNFVALSQADGQARVGHHNQLTNTPIKSITFPVHTGMDSFEPALMEWYTLQVGQTDAHYPFNYDPLQTTEYLNGYRHLVLEVQRQWEITDYGWLKTPIVSFQPESSGEPAPLKPNEIPNTFGEWCYTFDFQIDNGGFAVFIPTNADAHPVDYWSGSGRGTYYSGGGWALELFTAGGSGYGTTDYGLSIKKTFTACTVKRIEIYGNIPGDSSVTCNVAAYYFESGGSEIAGSPATNYGEVNYALDMGDGVLVDAVAFHAILYTNGIPPLQGLMGRVSLYGSGAISPDFGDSNC